MLMALSFICGISDISLNIPLRLHEFLEVFKFLSLYKHILHNRPSFVDVNDHSNEVTLVAPPLEVIAQGP